MDKKSKYNKDKTSWNFFTEPTSVKEEVKEVEEPIKIFEEAKKEFIPYRIMVNYKNLFVRKGPSKEYDIIDIASYGTEYNIIDEENGFGKISDEHWIMLSFTIKL